MYGPDMKDVVALCIVFAIVVSALAIGAWELVGWIANHLTWSWE